MTARSEMSAYQRMTIPDKDNRQRDDFYPTPPKATEALLRVEKFNGPIWEPACGDGAMAEVLKKAGYIVYSTDLVDYGYHALTGIDFLMTTPGFLADPRNVVTNPPFKLAQQFVEKALELAEHKVAIFARLQFLEGVSRKLFFESTPLSCVHVFSDRVPMQRGRLVRSDESGARMMAFAWFVWDKSYKGKPTLDWIRYEP